MTKIPNALVHESSLYLQQHAYNPVKWMPWGDEAFELAKKTDRLILVSVGYSACHWCHVMEHECFEDEEVAKWMNDHFVCIKVDREERPDVDQVYMTAVQLMTNKGGWPLNCFTLPDGRPIYGGTYFPKEQWIHVLKSLKDVYQNSPEKALEYAMELTNGVAKSELVNKKIQDELPYEAHLNELVKRWQARFDWREGGTTQAPKFPLPNNYLFLGYYGQLFQNESVQDHFRLTLQKMLRGGIYDQLGGGFSRYSVDVLWKIPHFEKMLYDNGQLLSVYALWYQQEQQPEALWAMESIHQWMEREMLSEEGAYFAAQDADSEGEEGKYYTWTEEELKGLLQQDAEWFLKLFNPENKGYWEHDQLVLLRNQSFEEAEKTLGISKARIAGIMDELLQHRLTRIRPGTDTKQLTAWNAMLLRGYTDAYLATQSPQFLKSALSIGNWILNYQWKAGNELWHNRQNGKSFIDGFLDDYAFTIHAFLGLYQVTGDMLWLEKACELEKTTRTHFHDPISDMYFFTKENGGLIARKMELNDNVLPATNSVMANNLLELSYLKHDITFEQQAIQQLKNIQDGMEQYGSGYSNWALLELRLLHSITTVKVPKKQWKQSLQLVSPFLLLEESKDETFAICEAGTCSLPISNLEEVMKRLIQG